MIQHCEVLQPKSCHIKLDCERDLTRWYIKHIDILCVYTQIHKLITFFPLFSRDLFQLASISPLVRLLHRALHCRRDDLHYKHSICFDCEYPEWISSLWWTVETFFSRTADVCPTLLPAVIHAQRSLLGSFLFYYYRCFRKRIEVISVKWGIFYTTGIHAWQ